MAFTGKVAIITGGGGGLGRAAALLLARRGANVLAADLSADGAAHTVELIRQAGGRAEATEVDVCSDGSVEAMVERARSTLGGADILVTFAGVGQQRSALKTTSAEFQRIVEVNLTGTFRCCRAAATVMKEKGGGRIVTIASMAGQRAVSGRVAYGASKAGVIMLTSVLAIELAPYNITVNCIAPGPVETPMVQAMHTEATRVTYTSSIPLHRYGTTDEIATAVAFLASDEASYITGHCLPVDGGFGSAGAIFDPDTQSSAPTGSNG